MVSQLIGATSAVRVALATLLVLLLTTTAEAAVPGAPTSVAVYRHQRRGTGSALVFVRLCGDHGFQGAVEVRHRGVRHVAAGPGRPGHQSGDGVINRSRPAGTSTTTGLTNGTEYTVRVLATTRPETATRRPRRPAHPSQHPGRVWHSSRTRSSRSMKMPFRGCAELLTIWLHKTFQ